MVNIEVSLSKIGNSEVRTFLEQFMNDRAINKEFYERIPDDKLDYRMVDKPERKSDSPRESLAHQVYVTRKYIYGVRTGVLEFDGVTAKNLEDPQAMSKGELLAELDSTGQELIELLSEPDISAKRVDVPWSKGPISVIQTLYGLRFHEVLHTGWNLAVMDHLNIERFSRLKSTWG